MPSKSKPVPFCVDCRHCVPPRISYYYMAPVDYEHRCDVVRRPVNIVTGVGMRVECAEARQLGGGCGPKGKLFERFEYQPPPELAPKQKPASFYTRVINWLAKWHKNATKNS